MKKFLIWLVSLLYFKKLILPILVRVLNIVFTVITYHKIINFFAHFAGLFKFLNTLLGLLLFLNMFDYANLTTESLIKNLYTFGYLIRDNAINLYNKIYKEFSGLFGYVEKSEIVQNVVHSKPVETINHLAQEAKTEYSDSLSNYRKLWDLGYKPCFAGGKQAIVEPATSVFHDWTFWLAMVIIVFLVGGLIYYDNPVKTCVKGAFNGDYRRNPDGDPFLDDSFFTKWFVKPVKKLFGYDKGKGVDTKKTWAEQYELPFASTSPCFAG